MTNYDFGSARIYIDGAEFTGINQAAPESSMRDVWDDWNHGSGWLGWSVGGDLIHCFEPSEPVFQMPFYGEVSRRAQLLGTAAVPMGIFPAYDGPWGSVAGDILYGRGEWEGRQFDGLVPVSTYRDRESRYRFNRGRRSDFLPVTVCPA